MLRGFAEDQDLEGAFGPRALTERPKGILMERHAIDEANAFEMLREHSRLSNRKIVDLAAAVVDGRQATAGAAAVVTRKAGTGENEAPIGQDRVWSS